MELQDLLKLSPVELASRVQELESRIQKLEDERSRLIDLMDKVREHKHNYSGDFGLVVSAPIQALVKEVISNPDAFIPDDIDRIIKIYADSAEKINPAAETEIRIKPNGFTFREAFERIGNRRLSLRNGTVTLRVESGGVRLVELNS